MNRLNIEPLTPAQKYILIGLFSGVVALFYVLRNLYIISLGGPPFLDVYTFYAAAEAVFTGHASPYNIEILKLYKAPGIHIVHPFVYLPSSLPFFWPMAGQDFGVVYQTLLYLNALLIVVLVVGMAFWTLRLTGSFLAALLMIPILTEGSRGLLQTLLYGQINAIIAIMLLTILWCLMQQRRALAGVLLGVISTIKLYPALLLPWLALRRDWVTLGWSLGTIAALAVLAWVWLPHYLWADWFNKVAIYGYGSNVPDLIHANNHGNLNINGLLMRTFENPLLIKLLAYGSALILFAATLFTAYKRPEPLAGHFAAFMWLTLLVAPFTWLAHLTYTLFAVVWFLAVAWNQRQYIWCAVFAAVYGIALPVTQVDFAPVMWQQNVPAAGLLIMWGMMQYLLWHQNNKA